MNLIHSFINGLILWAYIYQLLYKKDIIRSQMILISKEDIILQ